MPADSPYLALVHRVLLGELGRVELALAELARAEAGARNVHEAAQVRARAQAIRTFGGDGVQRDDPRAS